MKQLVQFCLVLILLEGAALIPAFAEYDAVSSTEESQAVESSAQASQIDPVEIQKALAEAGFYKGPIDGIVGKKTRAAIRAFQEKHDLKPDGVAGPKTWEKLKAYVEEAEEIDSEDQAELSVDAVDSADEDYNISPSSDFETTTESGSEELKQKLIS
ncbi:MAG: peptidoglycan-binding protein [Candidatus Omnitrophica bacterium]|nr:peptidoglycan-binding protein [Candidatus Omnitrophota bacterium]